MNKIAKEAELFVKKNKKLLLKKFADVEKIIPVKKPFTILMAGSPGAGKTEFSKRWMRIMKNNSIVRIDADEIREFIPQYNGKNSDIIKKAASAGVNKIYDHVLKKKQNAIIDGTFTDYRISKENIVRALDKKRTVSIFYVYQDPIIAWDFAKKREILEGRYIPKDFFIHSFFQSRKNVWTAKKEFGDQLKLNLVVKDKKNKNVKIEFDISQAVDKFIEKKYNKDSLNKALC
jgi:predicted ABC-type ATPase